MTMLIFCALCAFAYWLNIRRETKRAIQQIQDNADSAIAGMKKTTAEFIEWFHGEVSP